jgi:hypothetical protein
MRVAEAARQQCWCQVRCFRLRDRRESCGRSEEISRVRLVWGKAVALPRYHGPRFSTPNYDLLQFRTPDGSGWSLLARTTLAAATTPIRKPPGRRTSAAGSMRARICHLGGAFAGMIVNAAPLRGFLERRRASGCSRHGGQLFALVAGWPRAPFITFSMKSSMHSTVLEIAYRQCPSPSPAAGIRTASDT